MTPQRCQPSFAYSLSASPLAVSSTSRVLPAPRAAVFGCGKQCRPDAVPPRPPMYQHFRDIGTVWLILDLREDDLHGADDVPRGVLRRHQNSLAPQDAVGHPAPKATAVAARWAT